MEHLGSPVVGALARHLVIPVGEARFAADLEVPRRAHGLVLFVHAAGGSRRSPRTRAVAQRLNGRGYATLLFDMLDRHEGRGTAKELDLDTLTARLHQVTEWCGHDPAVPTVPVAFFGAGVGAAVVLRAATSLGHDLAAVVCQAGRPDLAGEHLRDVDAPTLLIVGGRDPELVETNRSALQALRCEKALAVVAGAGHAFDEPHALERVADEAGDWLDRWCVRAEDAGSAFTRSDS